MSWDTDTTENIAAAFGMTTERFVELDAAVTEAERAALDDGRPLYEGCLEGWAEADLADLAADERAAYEDTHPVVDGALGAGFGGAGDPWGAAGVDDDSDPFTVAAESEVA